MAAAAAVAVVVNRSENDDGEGPFLARGAPGEIVEEEDIALEPAVKLPDRVAHRADLKQRHDVEQLGLPGPAAKKEAAKRTPSARLLKVASLKYDIASAEEKEGRKSQELWDLLADFSRKREGLHESRDAAEAERAAEDVRLLTSLVLMVKQKKGRKRDFRKLFFFLSFVALYMTVVYLQQSVESTYEVVTAHRSLLPLQRKADPELQQEQEADMRMSLANEHDSTEAELRAGTVKMTDVDAALRDAERRPPSKEEEEKHDKGVAPLEARTVTKKLSGRFGVSMYKIHQFEAIEAEYRLDEDAAVLKGLVVKAQKKLVTFDKRLDFVEKLFAAEKEKAAIKAPSHWRRKWAAKDPAGSSKGHPTLAALRGSSSGNPPRAAAGSPSPRRAGGPGPRSPWGREVGTRDHGATASPRAAAGSPLGPAPPGTWR